MFEARLNPSDEVTLETDLKDVPGGHEEVVVVLITPAEVDGEGAETDDPKPRPPTKSARKKPAKESVGAK